MVDEVLIQEYIKTRLIGGINNQMWEENFLLNRLKASNLGIMSDGKTVEVRFRMGANQGAAMGKVIPRSGKTKHIPSTTTLKKGYGFLEIDGDAMAYAPDGDEDLAFMGALTGEAQSTVDAVNRDIQIALFGKGDGVRATCAALDAWNAGTREFTVTSDNFAWLDIGMIIDISNPVGPALVATYEITATDEAAGIITVGTALAGADPGSAAAFDSFLISNQNELYDASGNNSIMGMLGICDDGTELVTLQNVNSTTWPLWRARVDENGGVLRNLTEEMLDRMMIYGNRTGGFNLILTTEALLYKMAALINTNRQYVNVTTLKGGFQGIEWAGKEVYADWLMRKEQIFFMNTKHIEIKQLRKADNGVFNAMKWKEFAGRILLPEFNAGSVELYKALLRWDAEITTNNRKAMGRIADLNE